MIKYIKEYRTKNILIWGSILLLSAIRAGTSLVHTFAFNSLLQKNIGGFIISYGGGLLLWNIYVFGDYKLEISKTKLVQKMILSMKKDYLKKTSNESFATFASKDTGEYFSTLTNDMSIVENSGYQNIYNIISTFSLTIFSIVILISFDYRIMLLTVFLTIVLTVLPDKLSGKLKEATAKYSSGNSTFTTKIQNFLKGYETLYYLGNKKKIINQVTSASQEFNELEIKYRKTSGIVNSVISLISIFAQMLIMVVTGCFYYFGSVSFGAIASAGNVAGDVFGSLTRFNQYLMNIKSVAPILNKIRSSETDSQAKIVKNEGSLESIESLRIDDLHFGFEEEKIFEKFNLYIEHGNKYAIVGDSGSGKSTLINLILGNIQNFEGGITINEQDIKTINADEIVKQISFVGNNIHIYHDTLRNNITLWENYSDREIETTLINSNLGDLRYRLHEPINEKELSEGQKQRIGLARAFLRNKQFLILDEATANLDSKNSVEIENLILSNKDLTYLTITHHLSPERYGLFDQIVDLSSKKT